jgi:hypothetical protein
VDPSAVHAADIVYLFGLNVWRGRMKIHVEMTKYISACIINRVIIVSGIALTLCSNSWTNLWRDPKLTCFQADTQWWMAVAVRAMNVWLILSINDLSFIPIWRMP